MNATELKKLIGGLVGQEFRRVGQAWVLQRSPISGMLELQKSDYSPLFFVNLAFHISEGKPMPPESRCAFRWRSSALADDAKVMNLDEPIADDERREEVTRLVRDVWMPFLRSCLGPAGLQRAVDSVPGFVSLTGRQQLATLLG